MRKTLVTLFAVCLVPGLFAQSGGGSIQTATVTLTSAQLQHLKSAPAQLIGAPGSGQMLNVISGVAQYKAGGTPYTIPSGHLNFFLGDPDNSVIASVNAASFLDQSRSQVRMLPQSSPGDVQASMENRALVAANDGGAEWANGDGTVTITVYYTIVALQ